MRFLVVLALLFATACKDPFNPNLSFKETHFLVVEGYINIGTDAVTTIRLSRTVPVNTTLAEPVREPGATVLIEDDQGNSYLVIEQGEGVYVSDPLSLPPDRKYRISISTLEDKMYRSDFFVPLASPAIDSVSWAIRPVGAPPETTDAIDIYVSTHDPENKTHYYQWEYDEVWERRSPLRSVYKYQSGGLVLRDNEEIRSMRTCWQRAEEPDLITENTTQLSSDAITRLLIQIPINDSRLARKYSVEVHQHALSLDAYNYLEIMKKNTNSLGSFFDPQPSQLYGNIRHIGSDEPVIGFLGAYSTSSMRLFIYPDEIPWWEYDMFCNTTEVSLHPDSLAQTFGLAIFVPLTINLDRTHVGATHIRCADCRFWGANNEPPVFWDPDTEEDEE